MKITSGLAAMLILTACQQPKIGYVDNVKLMDEFQEKVALEDNYKSRTEELNQRRDSISQAFQQEAQDFQSKAEGMSQQKAQEAYGQLQQRGQMIGQQLQQEEQVLQREGQTQMDSLVKKVKNEIQAYGKENGYTYILGGGEGGGVLYGEASRDLTGEILRRLNAGKKE